MVKTLIFILAALAAAPARAQEGSAAAVPGRPITVNEAFRLALAKSEALAAQGQGVAQLAAFERQLKATFGPELHLNASESAAMDQTGKGALSLNLSYSLLPGMKNYVEAAAAEKRTEAAGLALARARQELYADVAQAYIDLFDVRHEAAVRMEQMAVSDSRIKELREREKIGRSREGEVLAARAQRAQDEADLQDALRRENLAQFLLRFLAGLDQDLAPASIHIPDPGPIGPYLARALTRTDIAAARRSADAARLDAEAQRKLAWPSLSADAGYYLLRPPPSEDSRWTAGLTLKLPLYTGGALTAGADQAAARRAAAEEALKLAVRQADTEVRSAWSALTRSIAVVDSLTKAAALADQNAKYQAKDYGLGLVTNLDVLNAQNTLLQTRLKRAQAQTRACSALVRLDVASGGPAAAAPAK